MWVKTGTTVESKQWKVTMALSQVACHKLHPLARVRWIFNTDTIVLSDRGCNSSGGRHARRSSLSSRRGATRSWRRVHCGSWDIWIWGFAKVDYVQGHLMTANVASEYVLAMALGQ